MSALLLPSPPASPQLVPVRPRPSSLSVQALRLRPYLTSAPLLAAVAELDASAILRRGTECDPALPGAGRIAVALLPLTWVARTDLLKPVHGAGSRAGRLIRRVQKSDVAGWDRCRGSRLRGGAGPGSSPFPGARSSGRQAPPLCGCQEALSTSLQTQVRGDTVSDGARAGSVLQCSQSGSESAPPYYQPSMLMYLYG